MVIDSHVHLEDRSGYLDELMDTIGRLEVDKIVLFSARPNTGKWATNDQVMEAHLKNPDRIIPFHVYDFETESPKDLERVKKDGFKGLKILNPPAPYNDEGFFPIWEKCEELGLIVTFHTGIVARYPVQVQQDIDSSRMKVIYIDRIARKFQKLTIFVAHLGNPDYGEACMMCRWHSNMYFDLSGSTLKKKKSAFFQEMLWWGGQTHRYKDEFSRGPWEKILFGTDVTPSEMADTMNDYQGLFDALELPIEQRQAVMGDTAARLLGLTD